MAYGIGKEDLISQYKLKLQDLNEQVEKAKTETKAVKYENMRLNKEYELYKEKTIDKIRDLEFLNIQYDKLKKENEKLKESQFTGNPLNISNNPIQSHSSQLINELKNKLNLTLEENINLQTDYENYKNMIEQTLVKKETEIDELKQEILSKDKIISQITKHRDFLLTTIYNSQEYQQQENANKTKYNSLQRFKSQKTPSNNVNSNCNNVIPDNFVNMYSKSFIENMNWSGNKEKDIEYIEKKLNSEVNKILEERKKYIMNKMTIETFAFDIIENVSINSDVSSCNNMRMGSLNKMQEMKLVQSIDEVLARIQIKKEKMIRQKNFLMSKYNNKD